MHDNERHECLGENEEQWMERIPSTNENFPRELNVNVKGWNPGCSDVKVHKFYRLGRPMANFMGFNMMPLEGLTSASLRLTAKHLQIPKFHPAVFLVSSIDEQEQRASNFIRNPKKGLKFRSEGKKKDESSGRSRRPKNPNNQNYQLSGGGLAALGALKLDRPHKNETQIHETENAEEKPGVALQGSEEKDAERNYRSLLPKQKAIKNSAEVNEVVSRIGNLDEGQKTPSLSGKEVILAMRKAYAEKAKQAPKSRRGKRKIRERVEPRGSTNVYGGAGEVRPITVKSEWLARIENLEKRLQEVKQWLA